MAYKLRYYSNFKDMDENSLSLQIYINTTSTITSKEITLASDPIIIDYSSGDLYKPLKQSACSVNVITDDLMSDLYNSSYNQVKCVIKKNNALFWMGFLTPNVYTSEYNSEHDKLTLEFVDFVAIAENTKFKKVNNTANLLEIMYRILDTIDTEKNIKYILFPKVYKINSSEYNLPSNLYIQEKNFEDEEGEAQSNKDVLNDIIQYYGMSLVQYQDKLIFLDYDAIKDGLSSYVQYNRTASTSTNVTVSHSVKTITNADIFETNGSISLGGLYNKVNVIAINNPIQSVIPDVFDDNDLVNMNSNPEKYYEKSHTAEDKEYTLLSAYFKSNENYYLRQCRTTGLNSTTVSEVTGSNIDDIAQGSFFQKVAEYEADKVPSSVDWKTYLSTIADTSLLGASLSNGITFLSLLKDVQFAGKGGYFICDIEYLMSEHKRANSILKTSDETYTNSSYGVGFENTLFPCKLSIDNEIFYDGDKWVSYTDYNLKKSRGYYLESYEVLGPTSQRGATWYKYRDSYGYWKYCNETTYNSLSASTTKQSGGYNDYRKTYSGLINGEYVYIEESYFHECFLGDRFYLVHKNNEGDKVFDETKRLTNTVSWKMNLANSSDGVAIPLPNYFVGGRLYFNLDCPNQLGTTPMYLTSGGCHDCQAFHISELKLKNTTSDTVQDIFNLSEYDPDILYTNVIDEDFVAELDDVELKVNTYSTKATSYSYIMIDNGNNYDYLDKTTNTLTNDVYNAEEHIINKMVTHYKTPKYQYSNCIINNNITPYHLIKETTLNKKMVIDEISYDMGNNSATINAIEL